MQTLIIVLVIIAVIVILALWVAGTYNSLVRTRNMVDNGWAQIDVQLKQRADLIPNLVETVKGYAAHEAGVFEKVTQARAKTQDAIGSNDPAKVQEAEAAYQQAKLAINAVAEAYPALKANQNFIDLQNQLAGLEGKIAYARQFYNDIVLKYDNRLQTFPSNLIAGLFHFEKRDYFKTEGQDRAVPQVSFTA